MPTLSDKQLHTLARIGAIARLRELEVEAAALRTLFPGLKKANEAAPEAVAPTASSIKKHKRKKRSLASRKAAAARMKAYWAKRKATEKQPKGKSAKKNQKAST